LEGIGVALHRHEQKETATSSDERVAVDYCLGRTYQRLEDESRRCCWKQSEQYTGLSPRGWKGTLASLPHDAQTVVNISRGPLL
jgi:hypothetical protein